MNASEVGFNGEVSMWMSSRWFPDLAKEKYLIKFTRGKTEHFNRAKENPNQFFWNHETKEFYYINKDKKVFRVEFAEV